MIIDEQDLQAAVRRAIHEDRGPGDVSAALIPEQLSAKAEIISREPMLVCGIPWVNAVFNEIDPTLALQWLVKEGQWLEAPATLCKIQGNARHLLTAERVALNFLQTLSGTATKTRHYLNCLSGSTTRLLDTRKTIPGLRKAQKYAVACAGGVNHRMGLYDAFLIKENHIKASGSIVAAIQQARDSHPELLVEVEVESIAELKEALLASPDRILLDNFNLAQMSEAVTLRQSHPCLLEASGGVSLETIRDIAQTGVDFISVGELTKSVQAIDLSLLIRDVQ